MDLPEPLSPLQYEYAPEQASNPWIADDISPTVSFSGRRIDRGWGQDGIEVVGEQATTFPSWVAPSSAGSRNTSVVPSVSTRLSSVSEWNENPFAESQIIGEPETFQVKVPWSDSSVGLSSDCNAVFFFKKRSISISSLASIQTQPSKQVLPPIEHRFDDKAFLREVAASETYLAILTDDDLMLFRYAFSSPKTKQGLDLLGMVRISWDPRGLAIHEGRDEVLILVGEGQQRMQGRIKLYRYEPRSNLGRRIHEVQTFDVIVGSSNKTKDVPKLLSFHPNGRSFVCVTGIKSSVLVWPIEEGLPVGVKPFEISHKYTAETEAGGITSASLFDSPSGKRYVLSTSSPSSERSRNDGEWSFISPVDSTPVPGPPLTQLIHRLVQLKNRLPMQYGAVPRQGNLIALLEKTGKIILIPLSPYDRGGLCSATPGDREPAELPVALCTQSKSSMGCLRFDPPGALLYAIDSKGKLIRASFESHTSETHFQRSVPLRTPGAAELPLSEIFEMEQTEPPKKQIQVNRETPSPPVNTKENRGNSGQRSLMRRVFSTRSPRE